jgi:hypothetical protein
MKKLLLSMAGAGMLFTAHGQSKVFREVSSEMRSQIKAITQDENLVGYLQLIRLEKASKDSFNYKLQIMDENLNDIGSVQFRDLNLELQDVSFEQDVLCLGYLRWGNVNGKQVPRHDVLAQFVSLDGRILKTAAIVNVKPEGSDDKERKKMMRAYPNLHFFSLKHNVQIHNLPQKGFALLYGEDAKTPLYFFNPQGEQQWTKRMDKAEGYVLNADNDHLYVLAKKENKKFPDGGYEMYTYKPGDSSFTHHYPMKDKNGNELKVLSFSSDPLTHSIYVSGTIINSKIKTNGHYISLRSISKGHYAGVFNMDLNGADRKESFTYWNDKSKAEISSKGYDKGLRSYVYYTSSSRDFEGNTYFVGSQVTRKPRWAWISLSAVTAPIMVFDIYLMVLGIHKYNFRDAVITKQNGDNQLSREQKVATRNSIGMPGRMPSLLMASTRTYYTVSNPNTHSSYVIIDDNKNINIYNVNKKTIERSIAHRDGKISTTIYPAKEGHIMVSEYNSSDRSTRLSIEAL